jgi:hypothetical protein
MPNLDDRFYEMLITLGEARDALSEELRLLEAQEFDELAFVRLLDATRSFGDQGQALVHIIENASADPDAIDTAKELTAFFWATEDSLEAKLGIAGRSPEDR